MPDIARVPVAEKSAWLLASFLAGAAALFVSANHPLWPAALPAIMLAWMGLAYTFPWLWWFALPACLPLLNFSPWTGWIGVEEFDLLVLASVAAGYARLAQAAAGTEAQLSTRVRAAAMVVAVLTAVGIWRGLADAGAWQLGWFQGYSEPLNTVRLGKSAIHALLLLPLLHRQWQVDRDAAFGRFALGMVVGAAVLALAALWERAAFPGLFDLSASYRTVGLFWEMHVGGAAIDAYVALSTPFVAWALVTARGRWMWLAASIFALLWTYAVLTTFSRGAYLGVAVSLLVLGLLMPVPLERRLRALARSVTYVLGAALLLALLLDGWGYGAAMAGLIALAAAFWLRWRNRAARRQRTLAVGLLGLALVFESVVVLGPDSYMRSRIARSGLDYDGRAAHWARGVALLNGPGDWLLGLGLGRLPARYDHQAPRGEFPGGALMVRGDDGDSHVRIAGPRSRPSLGGRFGLTQRVALQTHYRLSLSVRGERPAQLLVRVCESHLLYDRACQAAFVRVLPSERATQWQVVQVALDGPPLRSGPWFAPRQGVLTLSVPTVGASVEVANVALDDLQGRSLLRNGDFAVGLAHWLPAAQSYFVPWHIDNMLLELLIERGAVGLLLFVGLVAAALARQVRAAEVDDMAAPFVAASLCGVLCVGLFSSVFDVPRVALLLALLLCLCMLRMK